jgi:hypothetical protein
MPQVAMPATLLSCSAPPLRVLLVGMNFLLFLAANGYRSKRGIR